MTDVDDRGRGLARKRSVRPLVVVVVDEGVEERLQLLDRRRLGLDGEPALEGLVEPLDLPVGRRVVGLERGLALAAIASDELGGPTGRDVVGACDLADTSTLANDRGDDRPGTGHARDSGVSPRWLRIPGVSYDA